MTEQQTPRDDLVAALGSIAEIHATRPSYRLVRECVRPDLHGSGRIPTAECTRCRPVGHWCPVCGDHTDPFPVDRFACGTAELAATALMRETLAGTGTEQVVGRG